MAIRQDIGLERELRRAYDAAKKKADFLDSVRARPDFVAETKWGVDRGPDGAPAYGVSRAAFEEGDLGQYTHWLKDGPTFWFWRGWEAAGGAPLRFVWLHARGDSVIISFRE